MSTQHLLNRLLRLLIPALFYFAPRYLLLGAVGPVAMVAPSVQAAAPPAPTNVHAVAGNGQVTLTWTSSQGATDYRIYQGTSPGGEGAAIAGSPDPYRVITGLNSNTTYYFKIRAYNGADGPASAEVSATTAPVAPTNVTAAPGIGQITLKWNASPGATQYLVYQSTSSGSEGQVAVQSSVPQIAITGLGNNSTYYFKIKAYNGVDSVSSAEVSAKTAPAAPANLTATAGNGQVTLRWTAAPGATDYRIYEGTNPGGEGAAIAGSPDPYRVISGLANGASYYFTVRASNGSDGAASSEATATPRDPNMPLTVTVAPATLVSGLISNVPKAFTLYATATSQAAFSNNTVAVFEDDYGVTDGKPTITQIYPYGNSHQEFAYSVQFNSNSGLAVGDHKGILFVRICSDSSCATEYGVTSVQYDFDVIALSTNLTPLSAWPGIGDWQTDQYSIGHNAYIPVTLDATKFSQRWYKIAGTGAGKIVGATSPPVSSSANQLAYVGFVSGVGAASGIFADSFIYALNESDGSSAWSVDLGEVSQGLSAPTVFGQGVYIFSYNGNITSSGGEQSKFSFSAYNALTGANEFQTPFTTQHFNFCGACSPGQINISGGIAFANPGDDSSSDGAPGYFGRPLVMAFDIESGALLWVADSGAGGPASPALDSNNVYFYEPNPTDQYAAGLHVVSQSNGATEFSIDSSAELSASGQIPYEGSTPVLDGANGVIVNLGGATGNSLMDDFDISNQSVRWKLQGSFIGEPAVSNGIFYACNAYPFEVEARSVSDGSLLWTWSPSASSDDSYFISNVVLTNNLLFFSTDHQTYAIDISTHKSVWAFPEPGQLSISASGILYIQNLRLPLVAINLK